MFDAGPMLQPQQPMATLCRIRCTMSYVIDIWALPSTSLSALKLSLVPHTHKEILKASVIGSRIHALLSGNTELHTTC